MIACTSAELAELRTRLAGANSETARLQRDRDALELEVGRVSVRLNGSKS